jgi:hypothetical protein
MLVVCAHLSVCTCISSFQIVIVKTPLTLACMSPCLNFSVLLSELHSIPIQFCLTVPQQLIAFGCRSSHKSGEEKNVHIKFMAKPFHYFNETSYCFVCSYHLLCCIWLSFPSIRSYHAHILSVASHVTQFINLNTKVFMFLRNLLLENNSPFEQYSTAKCSDGL